MKIYINLTFVSLIIFAAFSCSENIYTPPEKEIDINNISIQNFSIYNTGNSGIPDNSIKALAIDNQNNLWIGTFNSGIAKYDGGSWVQYNTNNSGLSGDSIRCISVDQTNNIWIGTTNGLTKFDGSNWTVFNTSNSILPYKVIFSLAVDKNNILWIGCGHFTAGGVLSFDENNWNLYTKENSSLPSSIINVIKVDERNTKWIGTDGGMVKIDDQNNWTVYTKQNSGLLFAVNALTIDLDNNVWIGANELERLDWGHYYGGLQKFDGKDWFDFRPHPNGEYDSTAIVSNRVDHIICDRFGFLLIATETEWKYYYNLSFFQNGRWKNVSDIIENYPFSPFIRDLIFDKNNNLWLSTQYGVISISYSLK